MKINLFTNSLCPTRKVISKFYKLHTYIYPVDCNYAKTNFSFGVTIMS